MATEEDNVNALQTAAQAMLNFLAGEPKTPQLEVLMNDLKAALAPYQPGEAVPVMQAAAPGPVVTIDGKKGAPVVADQPADAPAVEEGQ